jgi:hypothetical protein
MNPVLSPDDPRAPRYWMHETSGALKPVIRAYLAGRRLDPFQIGLMRRYLEQWFDSPVWDLNPHQTAASKLSFDSLRRRVREIQTNDDIKDVLEAAVEMGADPL